MSESVFYEARHRFSRTSAFILIQKLKNISSCNFRHTYTIACAYACVSAAECSSKAQLAMHSRHIQIRASRSTRVRARMHAGLRTRTLVPYTCTCKYTRTRHARDARARLVVQVCGKRKVVSGLGIRTMKGSHPFVLRQNSDTARTWRETRFAESGRDAGRKEGKRKRGGMSSHFIPRLSFGNTQRVLLSKCVERGEIYFLGWEMGSPRSKMIFTAMIFLFE